MSDDLSKANNLQPEAVKPAAGPHADGIYFGMPNEEYHADPALGSSGIRDLMQSPLRYWINSPHNPENRIDPDTDATPEKPTEATMFGDYMHDLLLEGGTVPYAIKPQGMSFSTKAGKAWRDEQQEAGRTIISAKLGASQRTMFNALELSGTLSRFQGGVGEVSVFWTEKNGHRCKIRIDYLKADEALDLKNYANTMDKDTETAVAHTIAQRRISVQAYWYDRGIGMMMRMLHSAGHEAVRQWGVIEAPGAGPEIGNPNAPIIDGLIERMAATNSHDLPLYFVFCETGAVPNITARRFVSHDGPDLNAYWRWAKMGVEFATTQYAIYMKKFGPDRIWIDETYFKELTDDEMAAASWVLAKD